MSDVRLIHGDCLEVLKTLPAASVDAVTTDPPYALTADATNWREKSVPDFSRRPDLRTARSSTAKKRGGFMGQSWDAELPGISHWQAVLHVLKPGGYMLAFGGTRTYHRLACAIEDAGFEIRDCLMWVYGSGFPKGKGCLKPAWEPILLARKKGKKVLPLGIEKCRIGLNGGCKSQLPYVGVETGAVYGSGLNDQRSPPVNGLGRYPANVVHDGSNEVMEAFAAFGRSKSKRSMRGVGLTASAVYGAGRQDYDTERGHDDEGSAARFFYCAKASRSERNRGCQGLPSKSRQQDGNAENWDLSEGKMRARRETCPQENHHPTVKPLVLMAWLVKLVCPADSVCLDPFAGSGTTGVACLQTGRHFIGIERDGDYIAIARKRIEAAQAALSVEAAA